MIRTLLAAISALALTGPALAETLAITNANAWTGTGAGLVEGATLVIEDGTIVAIGADADVPDGAQVIDADGNWVTPGIIAAFSRVGLVEVSAEDSTNDTSAGASAYSVALSAADGFNPAATPVGVTRIEGVTRVVVAPAPSNSIFAGQGLVADTSGRPDSVTVEEAFIYVTMSEGGAARAGGSRPAAWAFLRAAFADARTFPARYLAHNEGDALHRVDAMALGPASRGQQPILFEAHRASDLLRIVEFANDNPSLMIAIVGADEGWQVADELAAAAIPVIVDPFRNLPETFQSLAATRANAARLIDAGVPVAFAHLDDEGHQARLALQVAGNAVAYGVSRDDALAALTTIPASIFGLDRLGTLSEGAIADVVIWDGDPLEVTSAPTTVIIKGEVTAPDSRQTRLRDRYLGLERGALPFAYRRPGAEE